MGALMRGYDWTTSPLGPVEEWSQSLRTSVSIVLSSRYAMFIWWGQELINLYNDAYRPFLGKKHPEALGQSARKVWAEIWDLIGPRADAVLEHAQSTYDEALLLIMDRFGYREETYFTFSYSPIRNHQGEVAGLFCAVTDETRRVIGERRLRLLREVAASSSETHTATQACIAAAERLAGNSYDLPFALLYLTQDDGKTARLAAHTSLDPSWPGAISVLDFEAPASVWPIAKAAHDRDPVVIQCPGHCYDGAPTGAWDRPPEQAVVVPIGEQGKPVTGFLIAGLNPYLPFEEDYRGFIQLLAGQITAGIAAARAYQEERRRAEALTAIDRAKTAFFSNVSHEFRTPLTLMLGPLEEALSQTSHNIGGTRNLIETAHRNGLRLLRLVNSLLDFSRIEAGRVQATYEPTDLSGITLDLVSGFRSAVERAGLHLIADCGPLPAPVYVDRDMWEKIVLNLLSNAFKYTFEGEIAVQLRSSEDGSFAELTVRDTGTGIPERELPRLFERFHRVEGAKGRTFEGSGIGLALVQELVKLHCGTIEVESALGKGSVFTVSIPVGAKHLPADRIGGPRTLASTGIRTQAYVEEALRWLPEEVAGPRDMMDDEPPSRSASEDLGTSETWRDASASRILLADDNTDMRNYARRLLAERGYVVEAVTDGNAALAAARRQKPDLVVSDVMMPGLDGFGLVRALRSESGLREVPIILLSARAGEEARIEGLDAGADDYLIKPFSARELVARVAANLQMARVRREAAEALRTRTTELETVLETVPTAVWFTHDTDAASVLGNREAALMLRIPQPDDPSLAALGSEPQGQYRVFRDGIELAPDVLPIQRAARGEEVRDEALEIRFNDGTSTTILMHATPLRNADGKVVGGVAAGIDITARKAAEAALHRLNATLEERVGQRTREMRNAFDKLQQSEQRLSLLIQSVTDYAIFMLDTNGIVTSWNSGAERIKGYAADEIIGQHFSRFYSDEDRRGRIPDQVLAWAARDGRFEGEGWRIRKDGKRFWANVVVDAIKDDAGRLLGFAKVTRDLTERRAMEEQLRHAQKMDAIGQLTGGVAHDFNNLLHVILSNLDMARRRVTGIDESPASKDVLRFADNAIHGAERASELTQRLLAFSRRQPLKPTPTDVNKLVGGMSDILRRTLGETVVIETVIAGGLWRVSVDANQLESAVLNLAVNARDAMPRGGKLTIETANTFIDDLYAAAHHEVTSGQYVLISVSDSGTGIPKEIVDKVFEPFFTTKERGKGTGLGLSQVYGFIKQSGGHVKIFSEVGVGTTVTIYLPRLLSQTEIKGEEVAPVDPPKSEAGELILLVEDDDDVRRAASEHLRELGYRVIAAPDGPAALRLLKEHNDIRLLFTDVGLPGGLNGRQLADAVKVQRPDLAVLFTTGYARNAIVHKGRLDPSIELLVKPFTYYALASKLQKLLSKTE